MNDADLAAHALARWLAPYLAQELGLAKPGGAKPDTSTDYDDATCASFVSALGDVVLDNGETFFSLLANQEEVVSLALASAIGVTGPRNIPGVLTTPLKRRAKTLGLPYPWAEDTHGKRTLWFDRDGIARRMLRAIEAEKERRNTRRAS